MRLSLFSAAFFLLPVSDALAHHPWEGAPLTLWHQGLLSGFAHPVLGFDHLAFLVALAVLCAVCFRDKKPLAVFIPATIAGVFAHLLLYANVVRIPFYETAVSLTVAAAGVFVFSGSLSRKTAILFTALFGLLHGYAYGGGITGAENSPLVFYLAGLAVAQTALVFLIALPLPGVGRVFSGYFRLPADRFPQLAGAALFVAGAVMSVRSGIATF